MVVHLDLIKVKFGGHSSRSQEKNVPFSTKSASKIGKTRYAAVLDGQPVLLEKQT